MAFEARGEYFIQKTETACAGAATAYAITHVCARAGIWSPSHQDAMIADLHLDRHGARLREDVVPWLSQRPHLPVRWELTRRDPSQPATRTSEICQWVKRGAGVRAAVIGVDGSVLRRGSPSGAGHAVALAYSTDEATGQEGVILVDPWPTFPGESTPPPTLDTARRGFPDALLIWCTHP